MRRFSDFLVAGMLIAPFPWMTSACAPPRRSHQPAGPMAVTLVSPAPEAAPAVARPQMPVCPGNQGSQDGWCSLGAPDNAFESALTSTQIEYAIGNDADPWVAARDVGGAMRIGHVVGTRLVFESVPSVPSASTFAFGLRGREPVVAFLDDAYLHVTQKQGNAWTSRKFKHLCKPIRATGMNAGGSDNDPSVAVDHGGDVWYACVEGTRGAAVTPSADSQCALIPECVVDKHPVVSTRLRVAKWVGERLVELPSEPLTKASRRVRLSIDAQGIVQAHINEPLRAFRVEGQKLVVAPAPTKDLTYYYDREVRRGTRTITSFQETIVNSVQTARFTLAVRDGDNAWRPWVGAFSSGALARNEMARRPALTFDASGAPVVAWNDGAGKMAIARWTGAAFEHVGTVPGNGPHGLGVDGHGDILIGSWAPATIAGRSWSMSSIRNGEVKTFPSLALSPSEWANVIIERTRINVREGTHVAVPLVNANPMQSDRLGFHFDGRTWIVERTPARLLDTPSMPWPLKPSQPGQFWTPSTTYPSIEAAYSALDFDAQGRPVVAWADDEGLHISRWNSNTWTRISDASSPRSLLVDPPAFAVSKERICIAWSSLSPAPTLFVSCHHESAQ